VRNHGRLRVAFAATIAVLLTGTLGFAGDDVEIREAIEARFEKKNVAEEAEVRVDVEGGEVTLTGVANSLPASREAEKLARKEAKVVHNQIRVHIEEPVKDGEIVKGVRKAILGYPRYEIFDHIEFGVDEGAVLLVGSVIHPWKKTEIEGVVARVPGIRAIKNDIAVQSFTRFDSDLRASLARQIYGDPRFIQYGQRSHPPIRILVDRGHVTLAGWVGSPVERAVLGTIALGTPSFGVSNELRVDGEVPAEDKKPEEETRL
jgi:osmotically-inducible protein OsmY